MPDNSELIKVEPETIILEESSVNNAEARLVITNLKHWAICYKIKSTAVEKATAKPAFGCIAPFGSAKITIKAKHFAFDSKERSRETMQIKVANITEDHNISRLSTSIMKKAFSSVDTTEMKIALIFQANKKSLAISNTKRLNEDSFEKKLNKIDDRVSIRNPKNKNISMYGDRLETYQTSSKRITKSSDQNPFKKEVSEDSCLGTASDPCNKKTNSQDYLHKKNIEKYMQKNYRKNENPGLSDVESAFDTDYSAQSKEKNESSGDEKESNIKLWANSASINTNMKSIEKSLQTVEKEIRDTDECVMLLSEKVHAKSKLITNVQKKVLEHKKESDDQIDILSERLDKLDRTVNSLCHSAGEKSEKGKYVPLDVSYKNSYSPDDNHLMTKVAIFSSALIVSSLCVFRYISKK